MAERIVHPREGLEMSKPTVSQIGGLSREEATALLVEEIRKAKVKGLIDGLESAAKFVAVTKSRNDIAMMLRVAIATAKEQLK